MKPNFIGLGAQKCASSWLYQVMFDHPQVFVSTPKELDFFSAFYDRGLMWYENYFTEAGGCSARGEVSPSYLPDFDAPARAKAYDPNFKIIICLRDPVARLVSNHSHDLRLAFFAGDDLSVEAGLKNNPMYVEQSFYAKHIKHWLKFFPQEQMLFLLQEEIKQAPDAEARRVYEFLQVDVDHQSEFTDQQANASYIPTSREKEAQYRQIGQVMDKMGLKYVADRVRSSDWYQTVKNKNRTSVSDVVPPLKEDTRVELAKLFASDMEALATLLGRDSLPWKSWQAVAGSQ